MSIGYVEESSFIEMINALGYEVTMEWAKDHVDATVFGDVSKTYLVGQAHFNLQARGPKGLFELEDTTVHEAKARLMQWILE